MASISIRADDKYTKAVLVLATKNGTSVAEMVRLALDEKYGAEIEDIIINFFAPSNASTHENMQERVK